MIENQERGRRGLVFYARATKVYIITKVHIYINILQLFSPIKYYNKLDKIKIYFCP
jgi:hypothetical protein